VRHEHTALTGLLDFREMTVQTQQFIELSDVLALRCECKNPTCRTVMLVPIPNSLDTALSKCPKCKQVWARLETGDSYELDIQRFVDSLKLISQFKMGCSLRLEVALPTVRGAEDKAGQSEK
jgi:hypothetical protein